MAEIKVRDLTDTSSVTLDNKLMVLTNSTTNKVQNITIEDYITNLISTKANNVLTKGDDNKLYVETPESITGELSDLTTTDKTTLVNAINEVKGDAGNLADLSNLTETGEERLHALKAYSDKGELLTDTEGLADVTSYAHSTFDLSKFTVVGSPVITSDGIASGFSSGNYLQINTNIDWSKPFKIKVRFKRDTRVRDNARLIGFNGNSGSAGYENIISCNSTDSNYNFSLVVGGVSASLCRINGTSQYIFEYGKYYDAIISYDGTNIYNLKYKESTASTYISCDDVINNGTMVFTNPTVLGYVHAQQWDGIYDLKQFSITVDGVPVFSGNRTGIDTIKPDDYTVVGTPTISADGVASGFSTSNYLSKSFNFNNATNVVIKGSYTLGSTITNGQCVYGIQTTDNTLGLNIYAISSSGTFGIFYKDTNNSSSSLTLSLATLPIVAGNKYNYEIVINGNDIKVTVNGNSVSASNFSTFSSNTCVIGVARNIASPFLGEIDLNALQVYINGDLAYQPCLKIPYTLSKTGSKVVNSVYRDRVDDMAEQFGSANYYTLSDTDFTLPQGELYGLIEKTKGNLSVPAYGNQDIGVTISSDTFTYTCPDDGYIYCNNIQVSAGGAFELSISRNGQSSYLILFGGASVDSSVQIPFIYPVKKGDVVQTLWSSTASTYPTLYFVPKEGV